MFLKVIDGMSDQLHVALFKVRLVNSNAPQFGGAHRREVARVREEHTPPADTTEQHFIVHIPYFIGTHNNNMVYVRCL